MHLNINGKEHEFSDGLSISDLVEQLVGQRGPIAVELNRQIVPKAQWRRHLSAVGRPIGSCSFRRRRMIRMPDGAPHLSSKGKLFPR